jgi:hypothetical protein
MKKSTVIATCLANSNIVSDLEEGEMLVCRTFGDERPGDNFHSWNSEIDGTIAKHIISSVGNAEWINVANFINDFS